MHTMTIPADAPSGSALRATERYWERPAPTVTHLVQRVDTRTGHLLHVKPAYSDEQALGIAASWGVPGTGIVQRIVSRAEFTQIAAGVRIGFDGGCE